MTSRRSREFSSISNRCPASQGAACCRRRERSYSPSARYGACRSHTGGLTSRHSFSASNLTGYGSSSYPKVSYNKRLLAPLNLDFDPSIQAIRTKEKDEIKTLNNQFAALIGKVQSLEQHNQVLLTRWNFLREQDNSLTDLDIKLLYDQYMNKLRQQIRSIDAEKEQLDLELDEVLEAMDNFRSKYEGEINKRSAMEFTFTSLKKDLDNGFLHKTELEAKLNGLHAMAELMKTIHEQELEEAMSQIKDVSIVLGIDNNRISIDPHRIVEDVRAQYEALARRSWEELEQLTRTKLYEGELQSAKYGDHLLNDRRIIAELNIQIQKMRSCILSLKSQCLRLEGNIKEVGAQGEAALKDARAKLANLEEALQNLRQDLAHLVKEYQELMNVKLALDIEILTYRELMEGEEISMESPAFAFISRIYSGPKFSSPDSGNMASLNVTSLAREASADRTSHSRGSLESGLSGSQSGGMWGLSGGDFSRSHSNESGGAPQASRYHSSSTSRGTLESGLSRSPSSRSGNFADVENSTESSISRSHGIGSFSQSDAHRSRDNLEGGLSRSASRGISEISLSRSQSNRSGGITDSVFTRTPSGASEAVPEGSLSSNHSTMSTSFVEGGLSGRQSTTSASFVVGGLSGSHSGMSTSFVEGGLSRSHSGMSTSFTEGGLSRSHSGMSTSFVEGGLSGSQSGESEERSRPKLPRTNSAEDGGVPVGGILRRPSRESSEARLSRSQGDKNESLSSHESEGCVEPAVSRTNSAEDGGVPVGGIPSSHSETSRYRSEGNFSRSQSDGVRSCSSRRREGHVEPTISRTNSAEDGGVPVGGIPGSQSEVSRYSPDSSLPRLHRGEDEARSNHRRETYAEPTVYRTGSAGDDGGLFRGHSGSRRTVSAGSLSRSIRDQREGPVDTSLPRAHSEGTQEGNLSSSDNNSTTVESGVSRSQNDGARSISVGSGFRTPSITSTALTDSVFTATPCTADENIHEEMLSRVPSGATGNVPGTGLSTSQSVDSEGPIETSTPICFSSRHDGTMERSLPRSHSGEGRSFGTADPYRSPSEASRDVSESKFSRNDSYLTAVSHPPESPSGEIEAPGGSPGDASGPVPQSGLGESYSHEEGLSRTPAAESASPGSTYLVDEVHSDNLYQCPAVDFGSKE